MKQIKSNFIFVYFLALLSSSLCHPTPQLPKMASMRDAMKRLQVIYENCTPEAAESKLAEKELDEFSRIKKKMSADVKEARQVPISLLYILFSLIAWHSFVSSLGH